MGIARRWVFPILRIIVFAVIAVALVRLAFFAPTEDTAAPEFPTGQIVEPQIPVMVGTVSNDIVLSATIAPAPSVSIVSGLTGEVRSVAVENGDTVEAGQEIARIRAMVFSEEGIPAGTRWEIVTAAAAGVVSSLTLFFGESASAGQEVGKIVPSTFLVTAPLPPEQQYRLTERPLEGTVAITGGPAPFTCTGLQIIAPTADQVGGEGGSATTVRCEVPGDVLVFAGLTAQLTIAGGIAENVLTLPMTAVLGAAENGIVYLVSPDGSTEERSVILGLNDGILIEIVDGLAEGDLVLEFVPGAPSGGGGDGGFFPMPIEGGVIIDSGTGEMIGQVR